MLIPRFELFQTDQELTVNVHAPYANIKDTEVYVEGTDFRFYSSPYYLRLNLPGEIVENDQSSGSYDCDSGVFVLKFSKVNPGEHFDNLDMMTTLLAPPREKKNIIPNIEVIGNPAVADENPLIDDNDDDNGGDEWFISQMSSNNSAMSIGTAPRYGFANKISGALGSFEEGWLKDVVDVPYPDSTPMNHRRNLREADEKKHFSDDHYTADLMQPEEIIKRITDFQPLFYTIKTEDVEFSDKEKDILKEMPNKEYLLTNQECKTALLGLIDILYGYCYNHRSTMGENTSESSWDINKISSTLSWFDFFSSIEDVMKACMRRSLCFPLYRHWDLSKKVLEDVKTILKIGKKFIVKKLCEIYELFNNSYEPRYLLNQLYIKDYIIWVQKLSDLMINSIISELEAAKMVKKDVELDLVELEVAAWSVIEEDKDEKSSHVVSIDVETSLENELDVSECFVNKVVDKMNKLGLGNIAVVNNSSSIDSDDDSSSLMSSDSSSSSSDSDSSSSTSSSSEYSTTSSSSNSSSSKEDINEEDGKYV